MESDIPESYWDFKKDIGILSRSAVSRFFLIAQIRFNAHINHHRFPNRIYRHYF
jgi:hypothetical protein